MACYYGWSLYAPHADLLDYSLTPRQTRNRLYGIKFTGKKVKIHSMEIVWSTMDFDFPYLYILYKNRNSVNFFTYEYTRHYHKIFYKREVI